MVQHIEGFQPESHVQRLPNWKDSRDLSVKLRRCWTTESIPADISIGSVSRTVQRREGSSSRKARSAWSGDLSEGGLVQVSPVGHASSRSQRLVKINRNSGNQVRAILAYICEGVIHSRCYVDRG